MHVAPLDWLLLALAKPHRTLDANRNQRAGGDRTKTMPVQQPAAAGRPRRVWVDRGGEIFAHPELMCPTLTDRRGAAKGPRGNAGSQVAIATELPANFSGQRCLWS